MSKQTNATNPYSFREKIYIFLTCILFIVFFTPTIRQSLWLDETVTYWVVKDGFWDLVYRAVNYQGQSPFYYFIVWCFIQILGNSEWVLRLPSLLSIILACFFLYQLCFVLFDREWALISVLCLICLLQVTAVGGDARPYGLALMLSILSIQCFVKWLQNSRVTYQIAYIIASAATCYAHIMFAPIFFIHLCYYFILKEDNPKVSFKKLVLTFSIIAGCLLPNFYQLTLLVEKRELYSFAVRPEIMDLLNAWFSFLWIFPLIAGFLLACIFDRTTCREQGVFISKKMIFILIWFFFPASFLFIISKMIGSSIFYPRYFFWSYPAIALVIAGLVKMLENSQSRLIAVSVFSMVFIIINIISPKPNENWRSAVEYITSTKMSQEMPIIVWPGLVEARNVKWSIDKEKQDYLLAPFSYYSLKNTTFLLPWMPDGLKLESVLSNYNNIFLNQRSELYLIVRNVIIVRKELKQENRFIQDILEDWLKSQGLLLVEKRCFGMVIVSRFFL
jgi:4-amino-4-deoxy-L-arabinose transferase-like glycosyltransferase